MSFKENIVCFVRHPEKNRQNNLQKPKMDPNQQMQYMGAVHGYITFNAVNRLEVQYFQ